MRIECYSMPNISKEDIEFGKKFEKESKERLQQELSWVKDVVEIYNKKTGEQK